MMERYLGVAAASEYLDKTPKAIYHLVGKRQIPFMRIGSRLMFDRHALDRWAAQHRVDATGGLSLNGARSDRSR